MKPNLVLVGVVLVTALVGFLPGITWAFIAGLTANLLVGDPLGSVPLVMLAVAAVVAGGARVFGRAIWIYPVIAGLLGSILADVGSLAIGQLIGNQNGGIPWDVVLTAAVLNAVLVAVFIFPARSLVARHVPDELATW